MKEKIACPACHNQFFFSSSSPELAARYCPFCRNALNPSKATTISSESQSSSTQKEQSTHPSSLSISFLPEHVPSKEDIQFTLGGYQVLHSIGKGGMGEVFLAYDTTCGRRLALKKIRPDLVEHKQIHTRFLKEARITSQLTHPAIIPIYTIHSEPDLTYYTMPYVEGENLKQLLKRAAEQERKGEKIDHIAASIPALIRIFLSICQAVAYAHSKHVLHRDLKPENIIVGQYGQIVILDWGLAKLIKSTEVLLENADSEDEQEAHQFHHITHLGKVVGTVAYMAPERALGQPANFQTDIYSLGVILYQLLTLKHPFHRKSLKDYRQNMHLEKLVEPTEIAPYRDVPRSLSRVVMKCLNATPELRYHSVDELIHALENYIEGRAEWFQIAELNINNKEDWEFQENVLIAEHVALTRGTGVSDWVSLMISQASFQENIKLEATVKIGDSGHGLGFLMSIPEASERIHLNDGYCLWLSSDINKSTKLLRSTVEVLHAPEVFLKRHESYRIRIEKIENNIHFYLNDALQFSYISHLPLTGTHIGLLSRDADFILKDFIVYIGSQNVTVNCLAVPDAFLAHKDYATALSEYRRIGYSFPGRAEGREAMFRAGITLLEQANNSRDPEKKAALYDLAQDEFHKLHNTPGAPLEYLGKALIYQAIGDYEEESKCFELAYRRYPHHPLLHVLQEQIVYRMHDSSRYNRQATFNFILFVMRFLPVVTKNTNTKKLLNSLEKYWEPLSFIEIDPEIRASEEIKNIHLAITLAFWLGRPYTICELIEDLLFLKTSHPILVANALFCLIELGSWELAQTKLNEILSDDINESEYLPVKDLLEIAIACHAATLESAIERYLSLPYEHPSKQQERVLLFLMEQALDAGKTQIVRQLYDQTQQQVLSQDASLKTNAYLIWGYLLDKNMEKAGEILHHYPLEFLSQETNLLHFLYGCWLYATEGKEIASIHFSGGFEVPYPSSWALFSYYLKGKIVETQGWMTKSFLWERRQLYRQLNLFYHCIGDQGKEQLYRQKMLSETIQAEPL